VLGDLELGVSAACERSEVAVHVSLVVMA